MLLIGNDEKHMFCAVNETLLDKVIDMLLTRKLLIMLEIDIILIATDIAQNILLFLVTSLKTDLRMVLV